MQLKQLQDRRYSLRKLLYSPPPTHTRTKKPPVIPKNPIPPKKNPACHTVTQTLPLPTDTPYTQPPPLTPGCVRARETTLMQDLRPWLTLGHNEMRALDFACTRM
jgi:hypothetical protein